jgi:hypothetical protein
MWFGALPTQFMPTCFVATLRRTHHGHRGVLEKDVTVADWIVIAGGDECCAETIPHRTAPIRQHHDEMRHVVPKSLAHSGSARTSSERFISRNPDKREHVMSFSTTEIGRGVFNAIARVDVERVAADQTDLVVVLLFVAIGLLLTAAFVTIGFGAEIGQTLAVST